MKKLALSLFGVLFYGFTFAQSLVVGATYGEIYAHPLWYDDSSTGYNAMLLHSTDYGRSFEVIYTYDFVYPIADSSALPIGVLQVGSTPGTLYNSDNSYMHSLLVSRDYGMTWTAIDDYQVGCGKSYWLFRNEPAEIVKLEFGAGLEDYYLIGSHDYGGHFDDTIARHPIPALSYGQAAWNHGEFFARVSDDNSPASLFVHTSDFHLTADTLSYPEELLVNGTYGGFAVGPDKGELYCIHNIGYDRRIDYSGDYGQSFRTVAHFDYVEDTTLLGIGDWDFWLDREPGVFYSVRTKLMWEHPYDGNEMRIDYYRAYGDILVTTYVHRLDQDWFTHHSPVMDCEITVCTSNEVTLHWNEPELKPEETLVGYQVYRGETLANVSLLTETEYTDAISGGGPLDYHILAVYDDGESSRSYNIVYCEQSESVAELQSLFSLHPNPANSIVTITGKNLKSAEVLNVLGQSLAKVQGQGETLQIDIANLPTGVYFVNVTDGEGRKCMKKVVKD